MPLSMRATRLSGPSALTTMTESGTSCWSRREGESFAQGWQGCSKRSNDGAPIAVGRRHTPQGSRRPCSMAVRDGSGSLVKLRPSVSAFAFDEPVFADLCLQLVQGGMDPAANRLAQPPTPLEAPPTDLRPSAKD